MPAFTSLHSFPIAANIPKIKAMRNILGNRKCCRLSFRTWRGERWIFQTRLTTASKRRHRQQVLECVYVNVESNHNTLYKNRIMNETQTGIR